MKAQKLMLASATLLAASLALTGCDGSSNSDNAQAEAAPAATQTAQTANTQANNANPQTTMNWYGGPTYNGKPALAVTAALVKAGGGADNFSFANALVSMLGKKTVNAEVAKLTKQYGEKQVNGFIGGMNYAVKAALRIATKKGISLPAPADLQGVDLAKTLVKAGTTPDGTWWAGYMFDKALSHDLHNAVMTDINKNVGPDADQQTHRILNQAMYDVAQALGFKDVKLATLH